MKPEVLSALLTALELECGQDVVKSEICKRYSMQEIVAVKPSDVAIEITADREHLAFRSLVGRINEGHNGRVPMLPRMEADSFIDEIFEALLDNSYFKESIRSYVENSDEFMTVEQVDKNYISAETVGNDYILKDDVDDDYVKKDEILDYVHLRLTGDGNSEGTIEIESDF